MAGSCTETAAVLQMVGGLKGTHEGAEISYKFPGATERKNVH